MSVSREQSKAKIINNSYKIYKTNNSKIISINIKNKKINKSKQARKSRKMNNKISIRRISKIINKGILGAIIWRSQTNIVHLIGRENSYKKMCISIRIKLDHTLVRKKNMISTSNLWKVLTLTATLRTSIVYQAMK